MKIKPKSLKILYVIASSLRNSHQNSVNLIPSQTGQGNDYFNEMFKDLRLSDSQQRMAHSHTPTPPPPQGVCSHTPTPPPSQQQPQQPPGEPYEPYQVSGLCRHV